MASSLEIAELDTLPQGIVKSVPSGDTVILMHPVNRQEKRFTLNNIQAPRLGRSRSAKAVADESVVRDEPFAWDSREYLRTNLIGQRVRFHVESVNTASASGKREYGTLFLGSRNMALDVVAKGWARVKALRENQTASADQLALSNAEEAAREQKLGLWNDAAGAAEQSLRRIQEPELDFEAHTLLTQLQRSATPGADTGVHRVLIDQVRDGGTVRVLTVPSMHRLLVHLTGIQCPRVGFTPAPAAAASSQPQTSSADAEDEKSNSADAEPTPTPTQPASNAARASEPFAEEARDFTSSLLLDREVLMRFDGVDKFSNFFGSVLANGRLFQGELLRQGFAKIVDWSLAKTSHRDVEALRAAEKEAQQKRRRVWKDYEEKERSVAEEERDLGGVRVIEVVSGDSVVIKTGDKEERVSLASIRAPRITQSTAEPYGYEAKEFLRSKLIGKRNKNAHISVDYIRALPNPQTSTEEKRKFVTLTLGGQNLAETLLRKGFASLIRHRGDEERSMSYDRLMSAEMEAKQASRGVHGDKSKAPVHHINDVSQSSTRSKQYKEYFSPSTQKKGVVVYVLSAHRYKVFIASESVLVTFSLSGVRSPRTEELFGEESRRWARERFTQREVTVEFEGMDKSGAFTGSLRVRSEGEREKAREVDGEVDVGTLAVENGWAKTIEPAIHYAKHRDALLAAEEGAKKAQRHIWRDWEKQQAEKERRNALAAEREKEEENAAEEFVKVVVSEIRDGGTVYLRSAKSQLEELENSLSALSLSLTASSAPLSPKAGDVYLLDFCGQLCRVSIESLSLSDKTADVLYVDYGNRDLGVPIANLRAVPTEHTSLRVPFQAQKAYLANIRVPSPDSGGGEMEEVGLEAAYFLRERVWENSELVGSIRRGTERDRETPKPKSPWGSTSTTSDAEKPSSGKSVLWVKLYKNASTKVSVNEEMVREGLARPAKRIRDERERERLEKARDLARMERKNMWRYGDVPDSDDEGM